MLNANNIKTLLGKWVVPVTKDCDSKSELQGMKINFEAKLAKLDNDKFVLMRKLTEQDMLSLDFIKYVLGFINHRKIIRLEKYDNNKVYRKWK